MNLSDTQKIIGAKIISIEAEPGSGKETILLDNGKAIVGQQRTVETRLKLGDDSENLAQ